MIRHYIDIATRNLRKHPGYTLIHLAGLSCGFAVALLIFAFVRDELSFDRFHSRADQIARLVAYREYEAGQFTPVNHMPLPLGPAMAGEIPSVTGYVRLSANDQTHVIGGTVQGNELVTYADPDLFTMFDFPLLHGKTGSLFQTPAEAVITEAISQKYFGTTDAVGNTLEMFLQGERRSFMVTGIARNIPSNSTIQFGIVIPATAMYRYETAMTRWNWWRVITYVQFDRPIAQVDTAQFRSFISRRWDDKTVSEEMPLGIEPLKSVHLNTQTGASSPLYSYILTGIGLIILFIAGINYVSLGIARGAARGREVALRKLFGAVRNQVVTQFLAESVVLALLAIIVGFVIAELVLPVFSSFVGRSLQVSITADPLLVSFGLVMAIATGVAAGLVPSIVLSRPQPADIFRRAGSVARSGLITRGMIVVQLGLSIFLFIATIVMHQQNQHIKNRPLGFSSRAVMVVQRPPDNSISDVDFLQRFKNELAGNPGIISVAATSASFNHGYDAYGWGDAGKHYSAYVYRVDPGYISTLGMKIAAGRDFASNPTQDATNPIIVNESLMRELGSRYAVGSMVPALDTMFDNIGTPTIVGVVKDYHFLSLHEQIGPALLFTRELYPYFQILVRIDERDMQAAIAAVERAYERVSSGLKCTWSFMDDDLARQYADEQRWSKIITASATFAISIAALGIFGLAGITAVRRSREVGIRKVLGASMYQVLAIINREFIIMVVLANILVWPIAWYAALNWLQNFAYHIDLSIGSFIIAAVVAGAVAMVAVSAHTIRAALETPGKVLRQD